LDRTGKAIFLLRVVHEQTVRARAAYVVGGDGGDAKLLRRSNELVHRLCGYTVELLAGRTRPDEDASVMMAILDRSEHTAYQLWRWLRVPHPSE
jgi:hypothetical protein